MKKSTLFFAAVSFAAALGPIAVFGAFHGAFQREREETKENLEEKRKVLQEETRQLRDDLKERAQQIKDGVREKTNVLKNEIKEQRADIKQEADVRRETLREQRRAAAEEIKKRREEFQNQAQIRRDALKKKLDGERGDRIERFFDQMARKFEAAIGRLENFADRIEMVLDRAAERGRDVASSQAELDAARAKIAETKTALEDAKAKYGEATQGRDFKTAFAAVRELVKSVALKVKEAHSALVAVVAGFRAAGNSDSGSAPGSE